MEVEQERASPPANENDDPRHPDPSAETAHLDNPPGASSGAPPSLLSMGETPADANHAKQLNGAGKDSADSLEPSDTCTDYLDPISRELALVDIHSGARAADVVHEAGTLRMHTVDDVVVNTALQTELDTFFKEISLDTSELTRLQSWEQHRAVIVRHTGRSSPANSIVCAALCTHERRLERRPPPPLHMTELFALTASIFARRWSRGGVVSTKDNDHHVDESSRCLPLFLIQS